MSIQKGSTRRQFLQRSAMVAIGLQGSPLVSSSVLGANETVQLALIGCGARGTGLLPQFLEVPHNRFAALCDVDPSHLDAALAKVRNLTKDKASGRIDTYSDFRRILDRQDIDAVIVATPDHWHAILGLQAIRSGKDVYLEKPVGHTIEEGQVLVKTARQFNRIVQVGLQQRSGTIFQEAVKLVRSGKIGKVSVIRCLNAWNTRPDGRGRSRTLGNPPDSDPPEGVDYDMWLGPAPKRPFNPNRFHANFHFYWDYGGGMVVGWGVHLLDVVLWAMDVTGPRSVTASGGKYVLSDSRETPDTVEAIFDFDGFTATYSCYHASAFPTGSPRLDHGIQFLGTEATLLLNREGYRIVPESEEPEPAVLSPDGLHRGNVAHQRAFLESVRSRQEPVCGALEGHRASVAVELVNISYRTRRKIRWDPGKERIVNDVDAAKLISKEYRAPWSLA